MGCGASSSGGIGTRVSFFEKMQWLLTPLVWIQEPGGKQTKIPQASRKVLLFFLLESHTMHIDL